jgi:hypothetical protein
VEALWSQFEAVMARNPDEPEPKATEDTTSAEHNEKQEG